MGAMDLQHIQYRELGKGLQALAGREDLAGICQSGKKWSCVGAGPPEGGR
jgi:hypothetical protein